ncbi:hypothetical protein DFH07DRAFT_932211 [Mycena maculata]|uniref:Heme haloperoxidase family profile domain-containing protein n=1 Tax=Mycena maculata TaxID=230809 RepID=A0AAD7MLP5_9AGAR|nr:hypothetical protein DFH07DRAFT_932211 [Mycena maculata]
MFSPNSHSKLSTDDHTFIPASSTDKRCPCPALNTLANHGYIPRRGTNIAFTHLLYAVKTVYNLSFLLALLLTIAGFLTCATFSVNLPTPKESLTKSSWSWRRYHLRLSITWTLDLADLSARGWNKIAHDGSLVHASGIPSSAPDPVLLTALLNAAPHGLSLRGLAIIHAAKERALAQPLSAFHEQVALGECALGWLVMSNANGVIEAETIQEWFGEERLPEGWWDLRRPSRTVGLREARQSAEKVQSFAKGAGC